MFNFRLKDTIIFQFLGWSKYPLFKWAGFFKKLFLIAFLFVFAVFAYIFFTNPLSSSNPVFFGLFLIVPALSLFFWCLEIFYESKIKYSEAEKSITDVLSDPEENNLAVVLSIDLAQAVLESIKFAKLKKLPEINSMVLAYFSSINSRNLRFVFARALLNVDEFNAALKNKIDVQAGTQFKEAFSLDCQGLILESLKQAIISNHQRVEISDVLITLFKTDPFFKKILIDANLKAEDIENLFLWLEDLNS